MPGAFVQYRIYYEKPNISALPGPPCSARENSFAYETAHCHAETHMRDRYLEHILIQPKRKDRHILRPKLSPDWVQTVKRPKNDCQTGVPQPRLQPEWGQNTPCNGIPGVLRDSRGAVSLLLDYGSRIWSSKRYFKLLVSQNIEFYQKP